ncbi:hypothetical protein DVS28_b0377 (plasmid) [Euzebya pacifica]|uniref:Uncharacterized protein n=1 Tax=Euzebya pacifica TaxID=1608957 RepID=A0A346Y6Q0_9ACTN|nr:hypothetical protein [Euzebya pacifica]AXV10147.1 hypothetical protein DVS28_b0377 [Euzebya pacifica]
MPTDRTLRIKYLMRRLGRDRFVEEMCRRFYGGTATDRLDAVDQMYAHYTQPRPATPATR